MAPKRNQLNYKNRKVLIKEIMQNSLTARGPPFLSCIVGSSFGRAMCLSPESRRDFIDYLYGLEEDELSALAEEFRELADIICNTVHNELRYMVMHEYEQRRQRKIRKLNRAMWFSSRRGRLIEKVKGIAMMLLGHTQIEKLIRKFSAKVGRTFFKVYLGLPVRAHQVALRLQASKLM